MNNATAAPAPAQAHEPIPGLAALVVKNGVALGGLTEPQRALALGFVWAGLPRTELTEKGVNDALKVQLMGAVRCLDTDHVELRRWLCDTGWLHRDGYGRAYRRVAPAALPPACAAIGDALEAAFENGATAAWAEAHRAGREAARRARRRAFEARPGAAAAAP
jgi:hypothetical protein